MFSMFLRSTRDGCPLASDRGPNTPQCYTKPLDSLKNWNNRFFWMDERVLPTIVEWRTSAPKDQMPSVEKSLLDFANEDPLPMIAESGRAEGQVHEELAHGKPSAEEVTTAEVVPEPCLEKEVVAMRPAVNKRRRKRGKEETEANAPPKVLRKDHAAFRPDAPTSMSDPDPLSYAKPQPRHERDIAQESGVREIVLLFLRGRVARGYLLAGVGRNQQLPSGYPEGIPRHGRPHSSDGFLAEAKVQIRDKNLETLLEAEVDMKKAAEARNAKLVKELESLYMEDTVGPSESFGTPSTLEKSPLDFANEDPLPMIAESGGAEGQVHEELAHGKPSAEKASQKGKEETEANAPPKVLRKDHAAFRPVQGTPEGESPAPIGLDTGSVVFMTTTQDAPTSMSDPDPLSYAKPQPRHERDIAQSSGRAGAEIPTRNVATTKVRSLFSVRSSDGFLAEAKVQTRDKNLETLLEAEVDMKKAAEARNAKLVKELESLCLRQSFADLVSTRLAKGMSEGLKHGIEHGRVVRDLTDIEAYDPEADSKYVKALYVLKDLKYSLVDQLEKLKDAHYRCDHGIIVFGE
nr:hypothetical protein [Tanacetum cinerariifolium]